ncbi:hypothetical protein ID0640_14670 [Helicobacter pylori]
MDLRNLENALNNGDFKEQVYRSLEGIYQISKVLNELDIFKNFTEYNLLGITEKIQALQNALAGYETSEQELEAKINALVNSLEAKIKALINSLGAKDQELEAKIKALVNSLEAKKQELIARLNIQLQSATTSETQKLNEAGNALKTHLIAELNNETQKLNEAGNALKTHLIAELTEAKNNLAQALKPQQIQGVNMKFLGVYVYGIQNRFSKNQSDKFSELFEFNNAHLVANKSYIVQFSMPYELNAGGAGIYSDKMGEMVLCLKANSNVYPIANSFYQNKNIVNFNWNFNKLSGVYRVNCAFKMPSEEADYKIAVFARWFEELSVNVNDASNTNGFEMSFLNNAHFSNLTTQSLPTDYNNNRVFYKHSQALIYEILE